MAKTNTGAAFAARMAKARAAKTAGRKTKTKTARKAPARRVTAHRCPHDNVTRVVTGAPAKWCRSCGAVYDGQRWHAHAKGHR